VGAHAKDANTPANATDKDPNPDAGYDALKAQGMSHPEIIALLARRVLQTIDEQTEWKSLRQGHNKGFA
jgi:hypothetical protein